jgi:hypothetical protein
LLAVFGMAFVAYADGPGGSTEHRQACIDGSGNEVAPNPDGSCPSGSTETTVYENDVTCGDNNDVGGLDVFVGPGGVEICSDDDSPAPLQGRIMAAGDPASQSGFVGADGDKDNPGQGSGWIGISSESGTPIACGDASGNLDLSHADSGDDINDCAP